MQGRPRFCAQCGEPVPVADYVASLIGRRREGYGGSSVRVVDTLIHDMPTLAVLCPDCTNTDEAWDLVQWIGADV